jgi:hypothetical protein
METGQILASLRGTCRKAGRHAQEVHRHATIILAAWAAISGFLASYVNDWPWQIAIPAMTFAVAGAVWLTWATYKAPLVVEQVGAIAELERELSKANLDARYGAVFAAWASACLALIERRCAMSSFDDSGVAEAQREFLKATERNAEALFGFERGERWSLTIYAYHQASNSLRHAARTASENHPGRGREGRTWPAGEGHVGRAWTSGRIVTTPDATDPGIRDLLAVAATNRKPDDDEVYRSYISAPFGGDAGGQSPAGVLVATSDRVGRFDKAARHPIEFGAIVLASFFRLRHKDV